MHELGLAEEIVDIALERAAGARVLRVVVEVGRLAAVLPDALRFAFEMLVEEDGPLKGATLEIREIPGRAVCKGCGADVLLDRPFGRCERCLGSDLDWLSGDELRVVALDLAPAITQETR